MSRKFVLIIEDDPDQALLMIRTLTKAGIKVVTASSLLGAESVFDELQGMIELVILDACLNPRKEIDTYHLLSKMLAAGFTGPIVASSSNGALNEQLMNAGATHQAIKWDAPQLALQLLAAG